MTRRFVSPSVAPIALALVAAALFLQGADPAAAGPIHRVALDPAQVRMAPDEAGSGKVRIDYPGTVAAPAGSPDLPRVVRWIEIPSGMRAVRVRATADGRTDLGPVEVAPAPPALKSDGTEVTGLPEEKLPPAGVWAELGAQGTLRGHQVVSVLVAPVQWEETTGRLVAARSIELELDLEPLPAAETADVVRRHRIVREIEAKFDATMGKTILGFTPATPTEDLSMVGNGPAGPGPYQPTFRPTTDGSSVEYVIVTSEALKTEFQRLADWKTQKGVQSAVRTVEWIDQTYPNGVDRAERIRFFIRDAYQNWGTLYVLLGGDTDVVQLRYAQTFTFNESIPADLYFTCLDGNWNRDGDERFGETAGGGNDQADLHFEVTVGRAPVSSVQQAHVFIDKVLLYEKTPPTGPRYPASFVALAERLFPAIHGATFAQEAIAFLPPWFTVQRLYEESASFPGSVELTVQSARDSINAGFGIVHHVGHGYRNSMSVGSGTFNNADADAFTNAPRNSVCFAINCSSASIDFNSIGERFVKNPNGGSIAYIGTSRNTFAPPARTYQNEWYATVFQDSVRGLGMATDMSRAILIPQSIFESQQRFQLLSTTLLGDPEADLYTNAVVPLQVAHPASVALDAAPITVTVTAQGTPVAGAVVTLWRANAVFVRATTNPTGTAELPITATETGALTLTVHRSYYQPYQAPITITPAGGPYVFIQSMTIDDDMAGGTSGDGDGLADAGETVELHVTLKNGGGASATGVNGTLAVADPENASTLLQGSVSYGTIAAGGSSVGSGAFKVAIAGGAPVAYQPVLTITATAAQGTWNDVTVLPLRRPYLDHYAHLYDDSAGGNGDGVVEAGETVDFTVTLRNTGLDRAVLVTGHLRALLAPDMVPNPDVAVLDSLASFGTLNPNASATGDAFRFELDPFADAALLRLELTLTDALGPVRVELLDVTPPAPPDSITAFGSPTSIRLHWRRSPDPDVLGYDIYRAPSPGGPFIRVNAYTVEGVAAFEDPNLAALTRYYYQVVTRDSSYSASVNSESISGSTNPPLAAGWPNEVAQTTSSSVAIADVDAIPGLELLCGAEMQYAWHADGNELVDGDNDVLTSGPISRRGRATTGFQATQALGDLDLDNDLEIVNVGWGADSLFVWQADGAIFPGWPKHVYGDLNFGSPLLADLDHDTFGDLEVVLWAAQNGNLFAWHHDGTELVDGDQNPATNGILVHIPDVTFNYGCPAIAQLDEDPELEIVMPVNLSVGHIGAVHAYNIDGTPVPGWPYLTGGGGDNSQVSSSPAVADLDEDGDEEIIFAAERSGGLVYVLNRDATVVPGWPRFAPAATSQGRLPSPVLGDLDLDGFLDIVFIDTDGVLRAWDRQGNMLPGFPVIYYDDPPAEATQSTPALGSIDSDGHLEIVFGDEAGRLHAYNHDGTLAAGFPIQTNGEVRGTPALGDIDGDGLMEIALAGFDSNVYVWDLTANFYPSRLPWPFFRHDTRNTGRVLIDTSTGMGDETAPAVAAAFHPVFPNPFNPRATLRFDVPGERGGARPVRLDIFDPTGRLVRRLVAGPVASGPQSVVWDGRGTDGRALGSGVYFARITIGDYVASQKLTLLR